MVPYETGELVDWAVYGRARAELGAGFARILGYFREDGAKSLAKIEDAIQALSAHALVMPAHMLKGEAAQFGAGPLSALAETIEMTARRCVEAHESPVGLVDYVARLRPVFVDTLRLLERDASPPAQRRPLAFGRKTTTFGTAPART